MNAILQRLKSKTYWPVLMLALREITTTALSEK